MKRLTFMCCAALLLALGCDRADSKTPEAAAESGAHAPAEYEPGTHEDWCGEHQVPESMCTRCNASLIPAFKATGDWCDEHGVPKSQCLACDPDLKIERPPREGS